MNRKPDIWSSLARDLRLVRKLPPRLVIRKLLTDPGRALRIFSRSPPGPDAREDPYDAWLDRHRPPPDYAARARTEVEGWSWRPRISLLMPVYDPPAEYLRAAISSVREQIYQDWELCIADDASTAPHVSKILDRAESEDSRIRVTRLGANRGISAASNAALELAKGDFVAPLDHDDTLAPEALLEVGRRLHADPGLDFVYTDHDIRNVEGRRVSPLFKPDWSPDLLLTMNYVTHFTVYRRSLVTSVGGYREGLEGSQDHDLILRVTERTGRIAHVHLPLYSWAQAPASIARQSTAKPYAHAAGMQAVRDAVARRGIDAGVEKAYDALYRYRVRRRIDGDPLVSIIATPGPGGTTFETLKRRVHERTRYRRYELLEASHGWPSGSKVDETPGQGEFLVFMSMDAEPVDEEWLETLLAQAQRPEMGAVGARLLFPNDTVRHAGYIVGTRGGATHAFWGFPGDHPGYWDFARVERNCSAVSGECLMVRRDVFLGAGGFDSTFADALADVDLCLRLRSRDLWVLWTPYVTLRLHVTPEQAGPEGADDDAEVTSRLRSRWPEMFAAGDPFYSPHLTRTGWDFSLGPSL